MQFKNNNFVDINNNQDNSVIDLGRELEDDQIFTRTKNFGEEEYPTADFELDDPFESSPDKLKKYRKKQEKIMKLQEKEFKLRDKAEKKRK